jgi:hypothetical protein
MLGRSTTCNVSGYNREVIHQTRVYPLELRTLIANFNGAIEPSRTIVSAQWDIDSPFAVNMSDAAIAADQRSTSVIVNCGWSGDNMLRVIATFDDGSQMAQQFYVRCLWAGWFSDVSPANGPSRLTVTAP